jgi:hypothetical protein
MMLRDPKTWATVGELVLAGLAAQTTKLPHVNN